MNHYATPGMCDLDIASVARWMIGKVGATIVGVEMCPCLELGEKGSVVAECGEDNTLDDVWNILEGLGDDEA
ncbi:hypothetical protein FRB94_008879 [Tulasnella sp. JGI-2019a]|nr:hypothetical protein FRB94_008879 [Tulasnella sp. JGI-2019a]KAG9028148.1 hypothetical protein FRB95_006797 [Tulasnella sp. JGI-2019a]